jgi:hypothetical protein
LWLGTSLQNTIDSQRKGRKKLLAARGEVHGGAIFSSKDVLRLRMLRARGWRVTDLANIFCASKQMVSDATLGRRWAHIETIPFDRGAKRSDARLSHQ